MQRDGTPLPKLPGCSIAQPGIGDVAFHKKQTLVFKNGYAVPVDNQPSSPVCSAPVAVAGAGWQPLPHHTTTYGAVTANVSVAGPAKQPQWLEYDKKVLRYFGYFLEEVPDSREEAWRARKVLVLVYLEDDSMQVTEPPETNSGLPQGTFIKRHKIPKAGGGFLGPADLAVGRPVTIYSRAIHIMDADPFTRDFAARRGQPLAEAQPYPVNPIDQYRAEKAAPSGLSRTDEGSPSKYAEALLGKPPVDKKLKQKLEYSNQVLRFFCIWDQRNALYGDRRPYKLHYYLADNTVEINEMLEANSGKDPFPAFLKRTPLPKVSSGSVLGGQLSDDMLYQPGDLRLGTFISVHGREFYLYDCDDFTRKYYKEVVGASDSEMAAIDVSEPAKPLPVPALPPWNGYGSPEDSLQNCIRLVPTAPKRDVFKLMNKERIVFRFSCKLLEGEGYRLINIDKERRFVLSFFCADDTLSIFEPAAPNSGITGGKYLERAKVYRPGSHSSHYTERDLFVGARLALAGRIFELLEADEFTYSFMEQNSHDFPNADFAAAVRQIKAGVAAPGKLVALQAALQAAGPQHSGLVTLAALQEALQAAGIALCPHQAITIFRRLKENQHNMISLAELGRLLQ